jgi:hypothetical protein
MLRSIRVADSRVHHAALLEDEEAIQVSVMEVGDGLIRGTIELRRGELILRALNTAVRNIRRVKFGLHSEKMVREVPNDPAPPEPKPVHPPAEATTASAAAAYMAAVARSESCGHRLCGDGSKPVPRGVEGTRPGGPEVPGLSAVAPSPSLKSSAAREPIGRNRSHAPQATTRGERSRSSEGAKDCGPSRKRWVSSRKGEQAPKSLS